MTPPCCASGLDGVFPSFLMGWVSCSPNCSLLALLIPNAMAHCQACIPQHVSVTGSLSSHCYRHLSWGLEHCYGSSAMDGPGTRPCKAINHLKGSYQLHHWKSITLSCCYNIVAFCTGRFNVVMSQGTAIALPHSPVIACHPIPQGCIVGMHGMEP
jgi:hypothetical protein